MALFTRSTLYTRFAAALFATLAATPGCAGEPSTAPDDEVAEEDLSAAGKKLVGTYVSSSGAIRSLTLGSSGKLTADIDNTPLCLVWAGSNPCPPTQRLEGRFTATKTTLTLKAPNPSSVTKPFLGVYEYTSTGATLRITRAGFAQALDNTTPPLAFSRTPELVAMFDALAKIASGGPSLAGLTIEEGQAIPTGRDAECEDVSGAVAGDRFESRVARTVWSDGDRGLAPSFSEAKLRSGLAAFRTLLGNRRYQWCTSGLQTHTIVPTGTNAGLRFRLDYED